VNLVDPQLSTAAQIAQLLAAGGVLLHAGVLRPRGARADLLLVLEMVHTDLSTDVHDGRMPALDPQVQAMARGLTLVRRLPPRAAVRALRAGEIGGRRETPERPWWDAADTVEAPSALTPGQEARMAEFRETLHRAVVAYLGSGVLRRLATTLAPRHRVGPRVERIVLPQQRTIELDPAAGRRRPPAQQPRADQDAELTTLGLGDLIPLPRF
jgi:hypothetical protein